MGGIAIFHDNLVQMGGAERVTEALLAALPGAALHTTLAVPSKLNPLFRELDIHTTWMRHLPAPGRLYRHYFLLYPLAVETVDLREYDVIVSNCWGHAKGIKKRPDALHVCYCQTPMRWAWRYDDYVAREEMGALKRMVLPWLVAPLRRWDMRASARPDFLIANSATVADRIQRIYGRASTVIHPPIDVERFASLVPGEDSYLIVSRLTAYKRIDLAIEACNSLGRRLVIIGDGPDRQRLQRLAGPTIEFLGRQPDEVVTRAAGACRALLFPGEEDFGMTPLEINAAGRPVVAWKGGGALETVVEGRTGVFFTEPTAASMAEAIERSEVQSWCADHLRAHAARFDTARFIERVRAFLRQAATSAPARRAIEALSV